MLINEAVEAKRLGVANDEDIELAMQKGVNYPKGLLAWGKEIGYSKISETLQNLYEVTDFVCISLPDILRKDFVRFQKF